VESEGKWVYHLTPEGETLLEECRDELGEIIDRVRENDRDLAGGLMAEVNMAFARLAAVALGRHSGGDGGIPRCSEGRTFSSARRRKSSVSGAQAQTR
jgi:hypothetical protein